MSARCGHHPAAVVARQALFTSLSEAECEALVTRSMCRATQRGETLFREAEPCRGLYLVLEGEVRVYRANADGREQVLGLFGPGQSLGDVSLFDDGPYVASARVVEAGRVLFLPLWEVQSLYQSHPAVARAVVQELGWRVRRMVALVDRITLQDVPTRVAGAVLEYASAAGALRTGGAFRLPRTQEELAAELGTARESVSRALRDLRDRGVIAQRGRRVEVRDPEGLRRAARMRLPADLTAHRAA